MLKIFQKNPIRVPITRQTSDYSLLVHLYLSMYLRLSSPGLAWFFPGTMGSIPEFWIDAGYWSRFLFLIFRPCSRYSDLDPHCFRCRLDNHIWHCKVTYSLIWEHIMSIFTWCVLHNYKIHEILLSGFRGVALTNCFSKKRP